MSRAKSGICAITVRGFKSICAEQRLGIRPLTLLAGANSSGKSSFMQPLLLLKQTLEAAGDPGALLLDGPNVRFTKAEQVLSHLGGKECGDDFSVGIELNDGQSLRVDFGREAGRGFDVSRMSYSGGKRKIEVRPGMTHEAISKILPQQLRSLYESMEKERQGDFRWSVSRERCFLSFELVSEKTPERSLTFGPYAVSPSIGFVPHIQGVIHLPGLRGNPRRDYPKTAAGAEFPGTFEPYVGSVIAQWQEEDPAKLNDLGAALEDMGLTWKVMAEPVDDTRAELKVGRLPHARRGGARDLVSIADVGFGVSQVLPVVVALLAARPGQLVSLEQPAIHLHPLAQRKLAMVMKSAADRGVLVVAETHSALLLREVQTLVATGNLHAQDVALHWFRRGPNGSTTVATAKLDEDGAYGDWPEDFDVAELEQEKAYLDAVEAKRAAK